MTDRRIPGLAQGLRPARFAFETTGERRRRRAFAAFATGAALFAAGWVGFQSDLAGAAGGGRNPLSFLSGVFGASEARIVEIPLDPDASAKPAKRRRAAGTSFASRRPVCVRLCDGFFFPVSAPPGGVEAACADLCPDAAAALYFLPPGSDRIEDAVSTGGARYSALPAALRYRTERVAACACHAEIAQTPPYWRDPTLRKGDAVMTASGFMIYRGGASSPDGRANFTRLAAAQLPRERRAVLAALERASVSPDAIDRPRIAAATPIVRTGGGNEIRFLTAPASATN